MLLSQCHELHGEGRHRGKADPGPIKTNPQPITADDELRHRRMDAEDVLKLLQLEEERSSAIKKEADRARNRAARIIQRNFANWRRRSERAEADLQRDREIFNADADRRRDREIFEQFGRDDL